MTSNPHEQDEFILFNDMAKALFPMVTLNAYKYPNKKWTHIQCSYLNDPSNDLSVFHVSYNVKKRTFLFQNSINPSDHEIIENPAIAALKAILCLKKEMYRLIKDHEVFVEK